MVADKSIKIKLKGHESFYIREGWLRKGLVAVSQNPFIFTNDTGIDTLGIGANMVKALRYWMQVTGLTEEKREKGGTKRYQDLTDDFGKIIYDKDPYFEESFTLALVHYKVVTNFTMATSWNLFFNKLASKEIYRNSLPDLMEELIYNQDPTLVFSKKSLTDDCNCIIKMYSLDKEDLKNPEDNLISPFSELGLIKRTKEKNRDEVIIKETLKDVIKNKLAILYVIKDNLKDKEYTTIESLMNDENNIGKVFNLDKNSINEVLDELENDGYLKINRTAGLNTVYSNNNLDLKDILETYYEQL